MSCNGPGDCSCQATAPGVDIEVSYWHELVGWTPFDTTQYIGIHLPYDCSDGLQDRYLSKVKVERWHGVRDGCIFDGAETTTQTQHHWTGQASSFTSGVKPIEADQAWLFDGSTYAIDPDVWHLLEEYTYGSSTMIHEVTETLSDSYSVSQFLADCSALYHSFNLEQLIGFAAGKEPQSGLNVIWLYVCYDSLGNPMLADAGEKRVYERSPYPDGAGGFFWYDALYQFGVSGSPAEHPWVHFNGLQSIRAVGQVPAYGKATLAGGSIMRNVVEPLAAPCGPWEASLCAETSIPMEGYVLALRENSGKEIILPGLC